MVGMLRMTGGYGKKEVLLLVFKDGTSHVNA
jgi:hypothetical protein